MAEISHMPTETKGAYKRKMGHSRKGGKGKKRPRVFQGSGEKVRIDKKMRELFQKRAREYNSDEEDEDEEAIEEAAPIVRGERKVSRSTKVMEEDDFQEEDAMDEDGENEDSDNDDTVQPGITKFTEGCRAFRIAFKNIIKKSISDDSLGPVLSAHQKLIAEKLAEEESEQKVKGEAKKEKLLVREKGHVKPANYLDTHEKFLIGVATKGVVKLFNAVNKAQNAQRGLNPSSFKDAKAIKKRKKEAFFSELRKAPGSADGSDKGQTSQGAMDDEGPAWAPLRDNYMLTNPKLKDWDKMQETSVAADDIGRMSEDSSSDDN